MKILKALGYWAASVILSLFIGLTLASSGSTAMRTVSAVCTSGIMICLVSSFAIKCANDDAKVKRSTGKSCLPSSMAAAAVIGLPGLVSWFLLKASLSGGFDYYRFHKLINGYFLQIFNFINKSASSSELEPGQVWAMLGLVFVPSAVFVAAYFISVRSGRSGSEAAKE